MRSSWSTTTRNTAIRNTRRWTKTGRRSRKRTRRRKSSVASGCSRPRRSKRPRNSRSRRDEEHPEMAVLLTKKSRVVVQGITGHQGQFHTRAMLDFGTKVVAGVTPGKGGQKVEGVPVFDAVDEAVRRKRANASIVFVPAAFARDAVIEAVEAGIRLITVIGPNCPGLASPGQAKMGIMPNHIFRPGDVGVISRSGTLTYEIVNAISEAGFGESTCIGIGGDPIIGTNMVEALALFQRDRSTKKNVVVGEICGTGEEDGGPVIAKQAT